MSAELQFRILSKLVGGTKAARSLGVNVGEGCRVYSCSIASERWLLTIGNNVTISIGVEFLTHDGTGWLYVDGRGRRYRYAPIIVGDNCFVGARSVIMPGVVIANDSVVAAGSVVTKSVPAGSIVGGNPAVVIGSTKDLLEKVRTWPAEADRTGRTYRESVDSIVDETPKEYMRQRSAQ